LITPHGTANVPIQFFFPNKLMLFFTPIPESAWAQRRCRNPYKANSTMCDCCRKPHGIQHCPAANDDHITSAIHVRFMKNSKHPLNNVDVIFYGLTAGNILWVSADLDAFRESASKSMEALFQVGIGIGHMFINPELNSGNPAFRCFKQIRKDPRVLPEHVIRKPKPVAKIDGKVHIQRLP
jgi:hypothetical protein